MTISQASVEASEDNSLWRPWIFQSGDMLGSSQLVEQTVDLQSIDPRHASLVVSAYLPEARAGDTVQVYFGSLAPQTYPKPGSSLLPKSYVHDVGLFPLSDIAAPGLYDVYYKVYRSGSGMRTSPLLKVTVTDSSTLGWRPHECSCFGYYPAGLVDAWVISGSYRLPAANALLRTIAGERQPDSNAGLQLTLQPVSGQPSRTIGSMTWHAGQWQLNLTDGKVDLTRGDLVALRMDRPAFLNLVLAM